MKNKMISITDELFELLKKEDNASALISKLLNVHYSDNGYGHESNRATIIKQKYQEVEELTAKEQEAKLEILSLEEKAAQEEEEERIRAEAKAKRDAESKRLKELILEELK